MQYLPICVDIRQLRCVIVGGGEVAARKAALLLRAGARVRVVAPTFGPATQALLDAHAVDATLRGFQADDLQGVRLVIAATDDREVNRRVATLAREAGLWVNVVDDPTACNFVMPAIIDRDPVLVAVSSSGSSPVLARILRGRIEALLPAGLGRFAALLGRHRDAAKRALPDVEARRRFWERVLEGPIADAAETDRLDEADAALVAALAVEAPAEAPLLYQVTAPEDDPDALTFRKARLMQRAETAVHDADVPEAILDRCRRDAGRRLIAPGEDPAAVLESLAKPGARLCWLTRGRPEAEVKRTLRAIARRGTEVLRG